MQRLLINLSLCVAAAVACEAGASAYASGPAFLTGAAVAPSALFAQAAGRDKWSDAHSITRPEIPSIVWWKIGLFVSVFICWARTGDWINRDCQLHNLGYAKWNAIAFFPVAVALLLALFLPFAIGLSILVLVYLSIFIVYVVVHNHSVEQQDKVFTRVWWRYTLAGMINKLGGKVSAEKVPEHEKGPKVEILALGANDDQANQVNLIRSHQAPVGYVAVKELIADMVAKRCARVLLEYSQQSASQRYQIDGVWHAGDTREREPADLMLAVLKTLTNLNANERQKNQKGSFGAKYQDHTFTVHLESQGTKTGERVLISLDDNKLPFKELDELGIRDKTRDLWFEYMGADQGLNVLSTLPGGGLTTLIDTSIEGTDRLMRDWASIEEAQHRERELENVSVTVYDATKGETPATVLPGLIRKYPAVYVVRDFVNAEAAELLFREIRDERLVITGIAAKDASEALLRILAKKVPQKDYAELVSVVLYQRLIRKLCDECKVGYEPTADVLQKLGIPKGRVQLLYRVPKPDEIDKPCEKCHGIGFRGQTGIFELLEINDEIREVLAKQPKLDLLRQAARNTGMRTLQEEGILLVAKGITSLTELMRVLKL